MKKKELEDIAGDMLKETKASDRQKKYDDIMMSIAIVAAQLSTCRRRKVGAAAAKGSYLLGIGYNGAALGTKSCIELGYCEREKLNIPSGEQLEKCKGVHAEQYIITQLGHERLLGATLYTTNHPCNTCASMIANSGIKEVKFLYDYDSILAKKILKEADIESSRMPVPDIIKMLADYQ